jgi:hypothetical protein
VKQARALGGILNELRISTITVQSTPEARELELEFFGADSPWELAAKDRTALFFLVGLNPMFDLAGTNKRARKQKTSDNTNSRKSWHLFFA